MQADFFSQYKQIHCIGIGGIGLSGFARLALINGVKVSGSDLANNEIIEALQKHGAEILISHNAKNIPDKCDLVVYSSAVPKGNPERAEAEDRGILQKNYFTAVGELSKSYTTIAITGMHGKSTTTALTGLILEDAGFDPTVLVGTKVPAWGGNVRSGSSKYLVIEACEYREHMKLIDADIAIFTSIDEEHMDYYRDLIHIKQAFKEYANKVISKENGVLVYNKDDENLVEIAEELPKNKLVSYGLSKDSNFYATDIKVDPKLALQTFTVFKDGVNVDEIKLKVPGEFNVQNALGAISAAFKLGVDGLSCKRGAESYAGAWRRFERAGTYNGIPVFSDYGHHPTEIKKTLKAFRSFFPNKRIVLLFEPHQRARTEKLFDEFVHAFNQADVLILKDIYDVAGREESSSRDVGKELADAIQKDVNFVRTLNSAYEQVIKNAKDNDIIIVMGAGPVDSVARKLVSESKMSIQENVVLAKHTTYKIGGHADYFVSAKSAEDIINAIAFANKIKIPFVVISGGSNVLVSDAGFRGLVIKNNITDISINSETGVVQAGSGASTTFLSHLCKDEGLFGFEFGIAFPGKIGGAIFGNAGCFGKEIKDILARVQVLKDGKIVWMKNRECEFTYRGSIFKKHRDWVIIKAEFKLKKGDPVNIQARMDEMVQNKKLAQPLGELAVGSVFKNHKTGECAWKLIDGAGFRGFKLGGAQVSEKHTNFILNADGATASDIKELILKIKFSVKEKFGVELEEEIQYVGF